MFGVIYLTENLINGKIYIGSDTKNSGNGDPEYLGSGILLIRAIEKYGKDNFKKKILSYCTSQEELKIQETKFIRDYASNKREIGYNISDGYWGGNTLSEHPELEEIKNKISAKSREKSALVSKKRKEFYMSETKSQRDERILKVREAMKEVDKSFFKDPKYLKNLSEGIKNSEKFQEYVKSRTGKGRGKYRIDQIKRLEERKSRIEKIQDPKLKSIIFPFLESDNSTFSTNLKVYLHIDGVATIPRLSDFIKYLEESIYTGSLTLADAKNKFISMSLDKEGIGKSTSVVRSLYDFDLRGSWPQRIVGASKKFENLK